MAPETGTALEDLIDAVQKAAYSVRHRAPTDALRELDRVEQRLWMLRRILQGELRP